MRKELVDPVFNEMGRLAMAIYSVKGGDVVTGGAPLDLVVDKVQTPRVLPEQVEALESANDKLLRIRAAREERAKRLGITS